MATEVMLELIRTNRTMGVDMSILRPSNPIKNQKGIASVETVVLMVIMIALIYYSFGFFGVVHTAIIHNIHSRTYAFETFRHRTNLMYFRSNRITATSHFYNQASRLHGIQHERDNGGGGQVATERSIAMGFELDEDNRNVQIHNQTLRGQIASGSRNDSVGVNPVWITVMYGMCFTADCSRR